MTNGLRPHCRRSATHRSSTSRSRRFKAERCFLLLRGTTMNGDMQPDWRRCRKCWPTEIARLDMWFKPCTVTFQGADYASNSTTAEPIWPRKPRTSNLGVVHWNLSTPKLYEEAVRRRRADSPTSDLLSCGPDITRGARRRIASLCVSHRAQTKSGGERSTARSSRKVRGHPQRMLAYLQGRDLFVRGLLCRRGRAPSDAGADHYGDGLA